MSSRPSFKYREFNIPNHGLCRVIQDKNEKIGFEEVANTQNAYYVSRDYFTSNLNDDVITAAPAANDEVILTNRIKRHVEKRKHTLNILEELVINGHKATSEITYELLKQQLLKLYGETETIWAHSTVCEWWREYKKTKNIAKSVGQDPVVRKRISERQEELIFKHLETVFLTKDTFSDSVSEAHSSYSKDEYFENSDEEPVSYSTFIRRRNEILDVIKVFATGSDAEKRRKAYRYKGKMKVERVLERVEQDASPYNLSLLDDNGKTTEGVQLFAAVDCKSNYPMGVYVKFGKGESSEDYQRLFREIITGTCPTLNANGIPYCIVGDNSGGARATNTREVYHNSKVKYHTLSPHTPWGKGHIEGLFNIWEKNFFRNFSHVYTDTKGNKVQVTGIPGYLPDSEDYRVHKTQKDRAVMKKSEFLRCLNIYLSQYINTTQPELGGRTPQQVWNEGIAEQNPPKLTVNDLNYAFMLSSTSVDRTLYETGTVYFDNAFYQHEELKDLHNELSTKGHKEIIVNVYHSRWDVRTIKVVGQNPTGQGTVVIYPERITHLEMDSEIPFGTDKPVKVEKPYFPPTETDAPLDKKKKEKKNKAEETKEEDFQKRKVEAFDLDNQIVPSLSAMIQASNAIFNTSVPVNSTANFFMKRRNKRKEHNIENDLQSKLFDEHENPPTESDLNKWGYDEDIKT
ncbi:hypothetical protein [Colwellia psychrerythraea]|uniref:Integrase catalytic domain-containing protein n=1 Tax=Colwellia psychrerythraea (strain 34H / ATCC BAA-681) TaxID=167879 RepID=Q484Z6_COLP3|nr:hypothetical protein [Colwellia psychrerythraea]AAZ24935.1 hypothetical protein CPS_1631 [Colwellia psychrerythraea 34H]